MWKRKLLPVVSTIAILGAIPLSASATVATKNVQANYHNIKVKYNGSVVSTNIEPFIINGTTYIPLRMMAGVFNKDITWDGTSYTIDVKDKADSQVSSLQAQIASKDSQIKSLEQQLADAKAKITKLEDDNDKDDEDIEDLDDMEKYLNDEYGDYEKYDWDISLDGDEDKEIEVEIQVDQDDYDELDDSDIEDLVEKIIDDIWDEFEDADIDGTIIDEDDDEIIDFSGDADKETIKVDGDEI